MAARTDGPQSGADPPEDHPEGVSPVQRVIRRGRLALRVVLAALMVADHLDLFGPVDGTIPTALALAKVVGTAIQEFYEKFLGRETS